MKPAPQPGLGPAFITERTLPPSPNTLGRSLRARLLERLWRATDRAPDEIIGTPAFLDRWDLVPRNRWRSFYLHKIHGSDNEPILHDHPWPSLSFILAGSYVEHTIHAGGIHVRQVRKAGDIIFRLPATPHRLEMPDGLDAPCWTLFLAGPRLREWGFHAEDGWIPWQEFKRQRSETPSVQSQPIEVTGAMAEAAAKVLAETLRVSWEGLRPGRAHPYPTWWGGGHCNARQDDFIDLARRMTDAALAARSCAEPANLTRTLPASEHMSAGESDAR
jgi:hypothetical protein